MGTGHVDGAGMCIWGPGRMDGAQDAWMGPRTHGWGPGRMDGAQDVWEGVECALLSWWLTRGGRVLAVGTDTGSTRDMPVAGSRGVCMGTHWFETCYCTVYGDLLCTRIAHACCTAHV